MEAKRGDLPCLDGCVDQNCVPSFLNLPVDLARRGCSTVITMEAVARRPPKGQRVTAEHG